MLKSPTNLLARNENSRKGRGGKEAGKDGGREGGRERDGRVGIESRKKRRELMYGRKRGWRWSLRWQDEKGFSSLLTGLLANAQDDKRQNGHRHHQQGPTLGCLTGAGSIRCHRHACGAGNGPSRQRSPTPGPAAVRGHQVAGRTGRINNLYDFHFM